MKDLAVLVWLTQFGFSVAAPLICFPLLARWLQRALGWGSWIFWAGLILGIISAVDALRTSLKVLKRLTDKKKTDEPPLSFSEHD